MDMCVTGSDSGRREILFHLSSLLLVSEDMDMIKCGIL